MTQSSRGRIPIRVLAAAVAAAALAMTSCSNSSPPAGPSPPPASAASGAASSAPAATSAPAAPAAPAGCAGGWQTGPATVTHQIPVPPVPVATAIRSGSHPDCKFDRLVVDFNGPLPGYTLRFVTTVIQDASGTSITLPGTTFLEVRFNPAQGHSATGVTTLPVTVQSAGYPMLKSYAVAGDFEGYLTIALGLAGGTRYRTGELSGRVYVDVPW